MSQTQSYGEKEEERSFLPKPPGLRFYLDSDCKQELEYSTWRPNGLKLSAAAKQKLMSSGKSRIYFQVYWQKIRFAKAVELKFSDVEGDKHQIKVTEHPHLVALYGTKDHDPQAALGFAPMMIEFKGRRIYTLGKRIKRNIFLFLFLGAMIIVPIDLFDHFGDSNRLYLRIQSLEERIELAERNATHSAIAHDAARTEYVASQEEGAQNIADYDAHITRLQGMPGQVLRTDVFDLRDQKFRTGVELSEIRIRVATLQGEMQADQELLEQLVNEYEHAVSEYENLTYPARLLSWRDWGWDIIQNLVEKLRS